MKASELIKELQALIAVHGDGEVQLHADYDGDCSVWSPLYRVSVYQSSIFTYTLDGSPEE